jgi:catechol 2,3-dioxygenase-like lactoylglutathione lyase family enzyme
MQISHAVVYVRDLDAMLDFYGELGFVVSDRATVGPYSLK